MGLVTKNASQVVDFANGQRRAGLSRTEALIAAARVRLRPILMTTLAMIFGMLPLAFELGAGGVKSRWRFRRRPRAGETSRPNTLGPRR